MAGIDLLAVPYKGTPATITDVLGGSLDATLVDPGQAMAQVKGGKIARARRQLAQAQSGHAGLAGDFRDVSWLRLRRMECVGRTSRHVARAREQDQCRDERRRSSRRRSSTSMPRRGTTPLVMTPDEVKAFIDAETAKWIRLAKEANIQPEIDLTKLADARVITVNARCTCGPHRAVQGDDDRAPRRRSARRADRHRVRGHLPLRHRPRAQRARQDDVPAGAGARDRRALSRRRVAASRSSRWAITRAWATWSTPAASATTAVQDSSSTAAAAGC